jgi:muconate cycloisomerase
LETLIGAMDKQIKGNKYAKGALEMACVDLVARAAGVPAYQLFGGQVRDRIPVLWVLATGDAEADTAEAEAPAQLPGATIQRSVENHAG